MHLRYISSLTLLVLSVGCASEIERSNPTTIANALSQATTEGGEYISWVEHIIDDERVNGGIQIRGGDGIAIADLDKDGHLDVITAQEDSNHLRVAFGTDDPGAWVLKTLAQGAAVGAIEDVAVGDLNGDGWVDVVAACEEAHLIYLQNPGPAARAKTWQSLIPAITQNRGSWLRVFVADFNGDGRLDLSAANKGAPDIVRPGIDVAENGATSIFKLEGPPLLDESWREQVVFNQGVPNTALPIDFDGDGDIDVLAAKRVKQELVLLLNEGPLSDDEDAFVPVPIDIDPAFEVVGTWRGLANAFQADTADLNDDGRLDLVVNVIERGDGITGLSAGLGWLEQPASLDAPWRFHRIGNTLPDWVIGIHLADIDGDGDLDAVTGGYSGINILAGSYSGASRDYDEPGIDASASVGRISWFENPGDPSASWRRHDVSRRVRGMYDMFASLDMDGDGDLDIIAPRGNSGTYDGVFWLEQVRSNDPRPAFTQARDKESRQLPLPPADWLAKYNRAETYVAPNKTE